MRESTARLILSLCVQMRVINESIVRYLKERNLLVSAVTNPLTNQILLLLRQPVWLYNINQAITLVSNKKHNIVDYITTSKQWNVWRVQMYALYIFISVITITGPVYHYLSCCIIRRIVFNPAPNSQLLKNPLSAVHYTYAIHSKLPSISGVRRLQSECRMHHALLTRGSQVFFWVAEQI